MSGLLIVQTGTTSLHGGYPAWFAHAIGFPMPVVRAHEGELLGPALERVRPRGLIVTGSPLSVTDGADWMSPLGDQLLRAQRVLGMPRGEVWAPREKAKA